MNDSLVYLKKLEAVGVPRAQAEVTVEIMTDVIDKNLATKQDLADLKSATKSEFQALRGDMASEFKAARSEMTSEFQAVRSEMTSEFQAVRSEMTSEFQDVRNEFALVRTDMERMQDRLTIRLGMMLVLVIGALATLQKLG